MYNSESEAIFRAQYIDIEYFYIKGIPSIKLIILYIKYLFQMLERNVYRYYFVYILSQFLYIKFLISQKGRSTLLVPWL